ncbi:MAG: ribosome small subunit-dependent GTPase A [Candidatus Eisenbacteria bacterium]|nr:ribosome small subunit-dependent GTPase A [Candidatus Eisenbacteria bacterium]
MSLSSLGWNARFETAFAPHRAAGLTPARVAREDRDRYVVLDEGGARSAELAGRLRHEARSRAELPAVGDWVALRPGAASSAVVHALLPRTSAFVRKVAGGNTEEQVVAANVDTVFLVSGLDGDFNPRRIERYLASAWDSGAEPVVVLNKADLASDPGALIAATEAVAPGVAVVALSALEGRGVGTLARWLAPGRTVALLGSSGVGKSTLVNALLGEPRQATGGVREDDSRGRHTTTHRELVPLPGGALLLDTPGMRELQLWGDESGLGEAFPEIAELARRCRFRDCRHEREPGCEVLAALERGELDAERHASWAKLQRELAWLAARQDARARSEAASKWKAISKSMKRHPKADRWR